MKTLSPQRQARSISSDALRSLPADKAEAIRREFPDTAEGWITRFDRLLQRCVDRWQLQLKGRAEAGLAINVIYFCQSDHHGEVVLKLGHPHPEQTTERVALLHYSNTHSKNVVRVIDSDECSGALLLQRIQPGHQFRHAVAVQTRSDIRLPIFANLSQPAATSLALPTYSAWLEKAMGSFLATPDHQPEVAEHLREAMRRFDTLTGADRVLHGDLHHENLLQDDAGGWTAIDPKGVIGPRILECGRFMHNFVNDELSGAEIAAVPETVQAILHRRARAMAEVLQVSPGETLEAGYIDLVLASTWSINSGAEADRLLPLIRVFRGCL